MKLYNTVNPNITVSPALGTDEEMEVIVENLIAASDLHDANANKVLMLEGREKLPRAWFTD